MPSSKMNTGKSARAAVLRIASSNGLTTAPPFDESLLQKVKQLPDVRAAIGGVGGEAQLIGKNGKAIVFGGAVTSFLFHIITTGSLEIV